MQRLCRPYDFNLRSLQLLFAPTHSFLLHSSSPHSTFLHLFFLCSLPLFAFVLCSFLSVRFFCSPSPFRLRASFIYGSIYTYFNRTEPACPAYAHHCISN